MLRDGACTPLYFLKFFRGVWSGVKVDFIIDAKQQNYIELGKGLNCNLDLEIINMETLVEVRKIGEFTHGDWRVRKES